VTGPGAGALLLAHHPLLTALPFVIPAVIVIALVGAIIWRDRREDDGTPD
jgi:hypothetical protein